jgi:3-hydroxybutyryl-CoA dehydrogenase
MGKIMAVPASRIPQDIMNINDIHRILVIGAGTMGQQIGLQCAMYGYDVTLYDLLPAALDAAITQISAYAAELVAGGGLSQEAAAAALKRIAITHQPEEAAAKADLVSESVPEDPELKGRVFAQFHALCPPTTIFTTNTSSLVPSMYAGATGRPAQFAALHFHSPVWVSNVVDVMPHPGTAPEVVTLLAEFARRIGQIPIVLQIETHGYVFNAMLNAVNREALTLAANGVAAVKDIDRAWMGVMKMPIGPFGIMDLVGLDTVWSITDYWAQRLSDVQLQANANFIKTYIEKGWLGVKTRQGFYHYPQPAYQQPGFLEGKPEDTSFV